jgi:hypothetical protein
LDVESPDRDFTALDREVRVHGDLQIGTLPPRERAGDDWEFGGIAGKVLCDASQRRLLRRRVGLCPRVQIAYRCA